MKIAVLTGFNDDNGYKETGLISGPNKAKYAMMHGYDFICTRNYTGYNRPISWFKIKYILELMNKYDYIFWSDADAVITNPNIKIENLIDISVPRQECVYLSPKAVPEKVKLPELKETNYIIAQDEYSPCMGNFIIKSSSWSYWFFNHIYEQVRFLNDPIWDNRAQDDLFFNMPSTMEYVKFLPKKMINSMIPDWSSGDFLIHFAATEMPRRTNLMREYLNKSNNN